MKKGGINETSWYDEVDKHFKPFFKEKLVHNDIKINDLTTEQVALVERIKLMFSLKEIEDMTQECLDAVYQTKTEITRELTNYTFSFTYYFKLDFKIRVKIGFNNVELNSNKDHDDPIYIEGYFSCGEDSGFDFAFNADWDEDKNKFYDVEPDSEFDKALTTYKSLLQLKDQMKQLYTKTVNNLTYVHTDEEEMKELKTQIVQMIMLL